MGSERGPEAPGDAGAERGQVASCFAGKDVFVTGGSGFIGRVLIEKLLREAPDVGTVFVLMRAKKGVPARERVHSFTQVSVSRHPFSRNYDFTQVSLFDGVRRQQPHAMSKVQGVEGDVALLGLGLSDGDRELLEERVAFVFHAAASVRFNDPLPKAVCLNTRGTSELCEMALRMRRLEAFIHVSTAYSNCNRLEIDEKLYPPPGDWRTFNELVDKMDPLLLDILTPKLVENSINTYIFTKALAEDVVNNYRHQLPVGIVRPSIVCPSVEEPFPGWTDNFYGPTTVLLGNGIGALHVNLADPEVDMNLIPVDYVVRAIMLLAVKLVMHRSTGTLPICNATSHNRQLLKLQTIKECMYSCLAELRLPRVYKWFSLIPKNND
ncbi:Putative fatty acyl-CoA reductase CG5065 [Gryllus bimaculatus]|nr:Putative fatty acyl-CoA reductase CG5065 [Gryllus bimaculatus]